MNLYAIIRRNGWPTGGDLEAAAARSTRVGDDEMPDDIRWIRSYVLAENGAAHAALCIYEASSPEAIRTHAERADLPVDEIVAIADTVIVRPDPTPAPAATEVKALTARATTSPNSASATVDCTSIEYFARWVSGITSVGLNAVALV